MAKLIEYDQVKTLKDEDVFLIDGERGTKTIAAKNLANDIKKNSFGDFTEYTDNKFSELDDAKLDKTGDASNVTSDIQSVTIRTNLATGEKLAVSLGKIKKFFTDLKTVAFSGSYNDLSNKPTIPEAVEVKGDAESTYRTGSVNITPENIGALSTSGGKLTGQLQIGEKVKLYTSSEGGNIQIISPDDIGLRWELDAFKGDLRFICFNNDGTVKKICQLTKDGTLIANNATQSEAGLMSPKDKKKLDNLSNATTIDGDTANNVVSFTSSDVADGSASAWTTVSKLSSGEKHSSLFAKVSQMFKNVRYLYKMLGTTDISKIGNGTCTGAISSLNSSLANYLPLSGGTMTGNLEMGGHILGSVGDLWLSDRGFLKAILDGKLSLSGGTMTGTIIGQHKLPGSTASDSNGMVLGVQTTGNTGIFNGNGDGNGADVANLIIKSWYGVGFVDGCSGHGMTVGIDCRSGNIICNSITIRNVGSVIDLLNSKLPTSASCNKNWNWAGIGGQPSWVWGGEDGTNMYVYNPSNFSVAYARDTAGVIASIGDVRVGFSGEGVNFRTYNKAGTAAVNGYTNLGSGSYRWKQLFATTATISTSDRNLKKDIYQLTDTHLEFFLKLQPVSFLFKDGESGRTHIGFIAQDVEQAMSECGLTDLDFAGFCKDQKVEVFFEEDENGDKIEKERPILDENGNPEYIYSLRYEEFIALNTYAIQKLWNCMEILKKENVEMQDQIKSIQQDIAELKKPRA